MRRHDRRRSDYGRHDIVGDQGRRGGRCGRIDGGVGMVWLVGGGLAAKDGRWSSAKMREGAWHKGGMMVVVAIALVADWLIATIIANIPGISLPFTYSVLLGPLVIVWYVIGELGSLLEHAVNLGAPVPGWLTKILEISQAAIDTAGDKLVGENEEQNEAVSVGDDGEHTNTTNTDD